MENESQVSSTSSPSLAEVWLVEESRMLGGPYCQTLANTIDNTSSGNYGGKIIRCFSCDELVCQHCIVLYVLVVNISLISQLSCLSISLSVMISDSRMLRKMKNWQIGENWIFCLIKEDWLCDGMINKDVPTWRVFWSPCIPPPSPDTRSAPHCWHWGPMRGSLSVPEPDSQNYS